MKTNRIESANGVHNQKARGPQTIGTARHPSTTTTLVVPALRIIALVECVPQVGIKGGTIKGAVFLVLDEAGHGLGPCLCGTYQLRFTNTKQDLEWDTTRTLCIGGLPSSLNGNEVISQSRGIAWNG